MALELLKKLIEKISQVSPVLHITISRVGLIPWLA